MKNMIIDSPGLSLFLLLLFGSGVTFVVMNDFNNNNVEYLSDKCQGKSLEKFVTKELKDRGYTKVSIFKPMIEKVLKENSRNDKETYWFVDINAKIKMGDITLPKKERLWCVCSEQGWFIAEAQQK